MSTRIVFNVTKVLNVHVKDVASETRAPRGETLSRATLKLRRCYFFFGGLNKPDKEEGRLSSGSGARPHFPFQVPAVFRYLGGVLGAHIPRRGGPERSGGSSGLRSPLCHRQSDRRGRRNALVCDLIEVPVMPIYLYLSIACTGCDERPRQL